MTFFLKGLSLRKRHLRRVFTCWRNKEGPSKRATNWRKVNKCAPVTGICLALLGTENYARSGDVKMKINSFCPHRRCDHREDRIGEHTAQGWLVKLPGKQRVHGFVFPFQMEPVQCLCRPPHCTSPLCLDKMPPGGTYDPRQPIRATHPPVINLGMGMSPSLSQSKSSLAY